MNLQDITTIAFESIGEFLDEISQTIIGKKTTLDADFTRASKLISARYKGFSVTGKKHLSVKQSQNNMLIVSPSGGGKTTSVIYPSIFNIGLSAKKKGVSMLINDPSGELIKTKNFLLAQGMKVKVLDFTNKYGSIYYNPLHRIKTNADVTKISNMLVRATSKQQDFWALKAAELIALCIHHLRETESRVHQNLANVFKILETLQGEPEIIDSYFADTTPKHLWRKFLSIMGNSENTRASIISSAQASLAFIGDDEILSDITSVDTFNFDEFREENTVVFLRCSLSDMAYYSTILSIFFEQFFAHVFRELPKKEDNNVFVIIDELSSLHLPNLANIISNSRKFNCPFLGVLQSENQLSQNYGEYNAKTILNNANTKIYFTGLSDESKAISDTLGDFDYEDDKGIVRKRNLMTRDEVRTMRKDKVIVIPSGMRPMLCKIFPYYKQPRLVRYMEMEAPKDYEELSLDYSVQYLDFDKYRKPKQVSNQNIQEDEI